MNQDFSWLLARRAYQEKPRAGGVKYSDEKKAGKQNPAYLICKRSAIQPGQRSTQVTYGVLDDGVEIAPLPLLRRIIEGNWQGLRTLWIHDTRATPRPQGPGHPAIAAEQYRLQQTLASMATAPLTVEKAGSTNTGALPLATAPVDVTGTQGANLVTHSILGIPTSVRGSGETTPSERTADKPSTARLPPNMDGRVGSRVGNYLASVTATDRSAVDSGTTRMLDIIDATEAPTS